MKYDIEAYLEGELTGENLAAFEKELSNNAAFRQEVEQQRLLAQSLKKQLLREEVTIALKKENGAGGSGKTGWSGLLGAILGLVALLSIGVYFMLPNRSNPTPLPQTIETAPGDASKGLSNPPPSTPVPEKESKENLQEPTETKSAPPKENKASRPIAQNDPPKQLADPLFPSPNIRGSNSENKAWKTLMDALWYTDFPPANSSFGPNFDRSTKLLAERNFPSAYVQLQRLERKFPESDTLHFLKGYCLLEMGEGKEANRYFEKLVHQIPDWKAQTEWYQGLSFLLAGDREKAIAAFKKIIALPKHPYRSQSLKALELLQ